MHIKHQRLVLPINPADVFARALGHFMGTCADHGGVWFAQGQDCCPSLGQLILPKRLAVHRRVGGIGIQLAKRTGDSFQTSHHSGRIS